MINIPKGTKDVLPQESYKWQFVENILRTFAKASCFREIRTPIFEHTEVFTRSIGSDTDVVGKEMYTFIDKGEKSLTLKPEGTASVARSFVENNLESLSLPLKIYYITPLFRRERPQKGRYRQHHQFGAELYGGDTPELDFEIISLAYSVLKYFKISDLELRINSIGCPECRKVYNQKLKEFLNSKKESLCPTCVVRLENNPLRILDCKVDGCKQLIADAPKIIDYICDDCKNHMDGLVSILDRNSISYKIDHNIVRGLDYYTKTVFEFVTNSLGSQGTVCGGGRYNNLVESIGGKPTPCVGFGMGIERLLMLTDDFFNQNNLDSLIKDVPDIFIAYQNPEYSAFTADLARKLRESFLSAETEFTGRSLKAQLRYADKLGAKYAVVIGGSEVESNIARVKKLADGTSQEVELTKLDSYILKEKFGKDPELEMEE